MTIDVLPDVALLEIFEFYVYEAWEEEWQTLVQVCRKWRYIVLGSPRRLNLRLYCRARTPVREKLDVWPLLPIAILGYDHQTWGMDNIVTALDHNDRVCDITIWGVPSSQVEKVLAAMQQSFPMLTKLVLQFGPFPIHSWVDLLRVCNHSSCIAFRFRDYQKSFRLPPTLSFSLFRKFLIPVTFHLRRLSLASPY